MRFALCGFASLCAPVCCTCLFARMFLVEWLPLHRPAEGFFFLRQRLCAAILGYV